MIKGIGVFLVLLATFGVFVGCQSDMKELRDQVQATSLSIENMNYILGNYLVEHEANEYRQNYLMELMVSDTCRDRVIDEFAQGN